MARGSRVGDRENTQNALRNCGCIPYSARRPKLCRSVVARGDCEQLIQHRGEQPDRPLLAESRRSDFPFSKCFNDRFREKQTLIKKAATSYARQAA